MNTDALDTPIVAIVARLLEAAGWTAAGRTWSTGSVGHLEIGETVEGGRPVPVYELTASGTAGQRCTMHTRDAHPIVDMLAVLGLLPGQATRLHLEDVARIFTEEAAKAATKKGRPAPKRPISTATVGNYALASQPGGRYARIPMPAPTYAGEGRVRSGARPEWHVLDEPELRAWWHRRPGQGVGGGRRPKQRQGGQA